MTTPSFAALRLRTAAGSPSAGRPAPPSHGWRVAVLAGLAAAVVVAGGCTTKKYVRQQTEPLINHVNQLDQQTAQNTNAIRQTRQQAQQGIAQANTAAQSALQQAQAAQGHAQQVGTQLDQTSHNIQALDSTIANLDDYKQVGQNMVHFAFNKYTLTPEARQTLDQVATQLQQDPHSIVEVEGYTDTSGPKAYNLKLSQWRADAVVQYLESKSVPPHRMFLIGMGENQPMASNSTLAGRKENRRVDLTLLTNNLGAAGASPQAGAQPGSQAGQ